MSVTLGIRKGKDYGSSEFIDDIPVSFASTWRKVWNKAISECNIKVFIYNYFSIKDVPTVLEELDRIYEWVQTNGGEDTEYISWRIRYQLKPFLIQFYQEHKDEDYWFDVG
ncbi:MAG TPA: hypothetical protein PLH98_06840 [Ruminococcus flavefaciens]|mgnify:CR=1 FL=1|nr:hypothetical protein [Ruminococcus flavefaciens]HQM00264.1 hypothetical protein [Ruminococcus flavefaciens]